LEVPRGPNCKKRQYPYNFRVTIKVPPSLDYSRLRRAYKTKNEKPQNYVLVEGQ